MWWLATIRTSRFTTCGIRSPASAQAVAWDCRSSGKLLGHANAVTTARYAHLDADPLRVASERIAGTIAAAMGEKGHRKARRGREASRLAKQFRITLGNPPLPLLIARASLPILAIAVGVAV